MKILLTAINAKYIHSNLAVYDLQAYARKELAGEIPAEIRIREYTCLLYTSGAKYSMQGGAAV